MSDDSGQLKPIKLFFLLDCQIKPLQGSEFPGDVNMQFTDHLTGVHSHGPIICLVLASNTQPVLLLGPGPASQAIRHHACAFLSANSRMLLSTQEVSEQI